MSPPDRTQRRLALLPLLLAAPALGGCVASIAAGALGAALDRGEQPITADLRQPASEACSVRAAQHGEVRVIDAEQRSARRVKVWGTVGEGPDRRAFECTFERRVTGFKLRAIAAPRRR